MMRFHRWLSYSNLFIYLKLLQPSATVMSEKAKPEVELLKLQVELWKEAISSTKHFTEMSVKMRQLGLTFVVAAFALAITLLSQYPSARIPIPIGVWDYDIHMSGPIIIASVVGLFVTKLLDVKLYHRMLRGSVAFTEELESKALRPQLMNTDRGLAESISFHSRSKRPSPDGADLSRKKTTAEWKIKTFYNLAMVFVGIIGISLTLITATKVEKRTIINQRIEFKEAPLKTQPSFSKE